ncbi:DNA-directed DNA polymerase [Tanacetum coccineum]
MTSEATPSKEFNETGINKNEPLRFKQDVQEKSHDVSVENKYLNIPERTTQPLVKPQQSFIHFPNQLRKEKEAQQRKFLENLKQLRINIRFIEALAQMLKYAKYMKSLLTNKSSLEEACTVTMNKRCSAVLLNKLPSKEKDPGSFTIPCQVDKFVLPVDFVILDMPVDSRILIILGRPFLATARVMIDVFNEKITLRVGDDEVIYDMDQSMKRPPTEDDKRYGIDDLDDTINMENQKLLENDQLDSFLLKDLEKLINQSDLESCNSIGDKFVNNFDVEISIRRIEPVNNEHLYSASTNEINEKKPELKDLPSHLEYAYLHGNKSFPIIILSKLSEEEKILLLHVLEKHKGAIAWNMTDIKGISPSFCTYKILMNDDFKRSWVSPIHVVPKKGGMIVVLNDNNELIPSRTVTGWRVCIDYRKLNDLTQKDHFPLLFIDQMLERLSGNEYYYFLDDFQDSSKFQSHQKIKRRRRSLVLMELLLTGECHKMLARCEETNLVLNWEKCHFMVKEGIVLGHKISRAGCSLKLDLQKKKEVFSQVKTYFWEEPCAFKLCSDNIMRRCVVGSETLEILAHCHSGPTGGHHSASVTAKKVYESRFY